MFSPKYALTLILTVALTWAQDGGPGVALEGTIRDSATKAGVGGALLHLRDYGSGATFEAVTDTLGRVRLTSVPPGEYAVSINKEGYLYQPPAMMPMEGGVRVLPSKDPLKLEFEVHRWGVVSGRVRLPNGEPAVGVEVALAPSVAYAGSTRGGVPVTDSQGRFELDKVPPGSYYLRAHAPKDQPASTDEQPVIVPTYFPDAADPAQARRIQVRPGANLAGTDIDLQAERVHSITGRIVGPDGEPMAEAYVTARMGSAASGGMAFQAGATMIQASSGGAPPAALEALSAADGTFKLAGLREGPWQLAAVFEEGGVLIAGAEHVDVGRRGADRVELHMLPRFETQVELDWGDTAPALPRGLYLSLGTGRASGEISPTTQAPRWLKLTGLTPGLYEISPLRQSMLLPASHYLAGARQGGRDLQGQPALLTPTSPPLTLVLKPNPGRATGTVENTGAANAEAPRVLVWNTNLQSDAWVLVQPTRTDGGFSLANLPPGSYNLAAFDRIETQGITIPFLTGLAATATRISVNEGSTATAKLLVRRWME